MNRIKEYAAAMNEVSAIGIANMVDIYRIEVRRRISLSRFIDGGAAKFAANRMNHHSAMAGNRDRSPLVRNKLRVWVDSYVELAIANRADLQSP